MEGVCERWCGTSILKQTTDMLEFISWMTMWAMIRTALHVLLAPTVASFHVTAGLVIFVARASYFPLDNCSDFCDPGSCPEGVNCTICPAGTANNKWNATNATECIPCSDGFVSMTVIPVFLSKHWPNCRVLETALPAARDLQIIQHTPYVVSVQQERTTHSADRSACLATLENIAVPEWRTAYTVNKVLVENMQFLTSLRKL